MKPFSFARTALLLVVVAGCPDPQPDPVDSADLESRVKDSWCAAAANCGEFPDVQTCAASLSFDFRQFQADLLAGIVVYDRAKAGQCVVEIGDRQGSTSCSLTTQLSAPPSHACSGTIVGTLDRDAPCFVDSECKAGLCIPGACPAGDACCPGSCGFVVRTGEDCSALEAVCPESSYCATESNGSKTCRPRLKAGAECEQSDACAADHLCLPDSTGAWRCRRLPATGEPCVPAHGCDSISDYCNAATIPPQCAPRAKPGDSCQHAPCAPYAYCSTTATCSLRQSLGEPCTSDAECQGTLTCIHQSCQQGEPDPVCLLKNLGKTSMPARP